MRRSRHPSGGGCHPGRLHAAWLVVSAALVLATAGCGSTVGAAPVSSVPQASTNGWQVLWISPSVQLAGLSVFDAQDVWVAGTDGLLYAWDGTGWRVQRVGDDLTGMVAVNQRDAWVSSDDGIRHWDGTHWTLTSHDRAVTALAAADARHVWVADPAGIRAWSGTGWTLQYAAAGAQLQGISAADSSHAWAVGSLASGSGVVVAFDGSSWSIQATLPQPLSAVYASDPAHAWAVSPDGSIFTWDGTAWRLTANLHMDLTDVSGTDAAHVWAVAASGEVLFHNGTRWAVQYRAPTTLGGVAAIDAGHVWAVGFDTVYSTVPQGSASDWTSSGL